MFYNVTVFIILINGAVFSAYIINSQYKFYRFVQLVILFQDPLSGMLPYPFLPIEDDT